MARVLITDAAISVARIACPHGRATLYVVLHPNLGRGETNADHVLAGPSTWAAQEERQVEASAEFSLRYRLFDR